MLAYPHERFAVEVTLTPAMVAAYAAAAGDTNPVHHDPTFAATTRYRRLIASGTHTTNATCRSTATGEIPRPGGKAGCSRTSHTGISSGARIDVRSRRLSPTTEWLSPLARVRSGTSGARKRESGRAAIS